MQYLKRTIASILMVVCMVSLLTYGNMGCARKDRANPKQEFQELIQEINEKNKNIPMPSEIPEDYVPPDSEETIFSQEDSKLWEQACARDKEELYVTKDMAERELDWAKRLLRKYYGSYYRFGGDKRFDTAVEKVLDGFRDKDKLESADYQTLLGEQFDFVKDSHFSMGYSGSQSSIRMLLTDETDFFRKDEKFYLDQKYRQEVLTVNGKSPDTYIKRAIGQDGALTWYPYMLGETGEGDGELKIRYREGFLFKKEKEKVIELSLAEYLGYGMPEEGEIYTYEEKGEVPYVKLNAFARQDQESAVQFVQSAKGLKEAPGALIDLTMNNGGTISTMDGWFESYTGSQWYPHGALLSREHQLLETEEDTRFEGESERKLYPKLGMKKKGSYGIYIPERQPLIPNNQRLFLLISRNSASCAELMTDACRGIENTVIIGTNTGGHLDGDIMKRGRLPLSGAWFGLGTAMFYWDDTYFQEGAGFEPDIYLTGTDCGDRLKKFWDRYAA